MSSRRATVVVPAACSAAATWPARSASPARPSTAVGVPVPRASMVSPPATSTSSSGPGTLRPPSSAAWPAGRGVVPTARAVSSLAGRGRHAGRSAPWASSVCPVKASRTHDAAARAAAPGRATAAASALARAAGSGMGALGGGGLEGLGGRVDGAGRRRWWASPCRSSPSGSARHRGWSRVRIPGTTSSTSSGGVAHGEHHDGHAASRRGRDALDPLSAGLASYGTLSRRA